MVLTGRATPDYQTIGEFRQRFTKDIAGLFVQELSLCQEAGLVRLGHISLDGTKLREDGKVIAEKLGRIKEGKARLEELAHARAVAEGKAPGPAEVPARAQTNFTDPDSRIMKTPDGFQQCYNAQEVSAAPPDVQRLVPMLEQIVALNGEAPRELSVDAGYASEANFSALSEVNVTAYIALRRYHHDEPPGADPAPAHSSGRWPERRAMRERLATADGKARYKLRKQTVEPVFGQIKAARGFRQFLRRGLPSVQAEWAMLCTVHNLLKLHQAGLKPA